MATSSAMSTNNNYVKYEITITQNSQSVNDNTSNVTVSVRFFRTNKGYKTWGTGTVYCKINGETYSSDVVPSQYITEDGIVLFTKTLNIPHNSDGSKTLTCSAWITHNAPLTSSEQAFSVVLTTIPRKSSISASDGTLGTEQALTVDRKSSSFTHTVTYVCGNAAGTICTKSYNTTLAFTPPMSLANQNTTGTAVSVTFTIETFNGSTSLGTNTKTIACAIPASVVPTVSLAVSDDAGYLDVFDAYVQSKSKINVVVSAEGVYGSSIKAYNTTADGKAYTSASFVTDVIVNSGALEIKVTVTDSRGRTASASETISVLAYTAPRLTALSAKRCDADGTINTSGAYFLVAFSSEVTALNGKNIASYVLNYKKATESAYASMTLSDYANNYAVTNGTCIIEADIAFTYDISLSVADYFLTSGKSVTGSSITKAISILKNKLGIAFGKVAELSNYMDVAWNARFRKNVEVDGDAIIGGTSFNNHVHRKLNNKFPNARPTSANIPSSDDRVGTLETFVAGGTMTEGKPPEDSSVIHVNWDNTNGWDAQVAVGYAGMYYRRCYGGTWGIWKTAGIEVEGLSKSGVSVAANSEVGFQVTLTKTEEREFVGLIHMVTGAAGVIYEGYTKNGNTLGIWVYNCTSSAKTVNWAGTAIYR